MYLTFNSFVIISHSERTAYHIDGDNLVTSDSGEAEIFNQYLKYPFTLRKGSREYSELMQLAVLRNCSVFDQKNQQWFNDFEYSFLFLT